MRSRVWHRLLIFILVVSTFTAYVRTLGNGFVNFDDPYYIVDNKHIRGGFALKSLVWAFKSTLGSNWHPLTWMSHMLDYQIFGLRPWGHHLVSLFLHLLNTLLLFFLLERTTGFYFRSFMVAGLFALHPLHVESVAWAAERKDVLSTFFWLSTMLAYTWWVRLDAEGYHRRIRAYVFTLVLFALGLMSKPMLVTMPFVLLLFDYWPLCRWQRVDIEARSKRTKRLILEKMPFFILATASSVVTYLVQQRTGAVNPLEYCPLGARIANALVAYVTYLYKAVWPRKLAVFYPHPGDTLPSWQVVGAAILLVALSFAFLWVARRKPYVPVGWLWYLGTLVPVIGLVQVGGQAMADRYTYVPLIGIFVAVTWWVTEFLQSQAVGAKSFNSYSMPFGAVASVLPFASFCVLSAFAVAAWVQVGYWKNSITLFRHAIAVTEKNDVAHYNLGVALVKLDRDADAVLHFSAATRINPRNADAFYNLGNSLIELERFDEAEFAYRQAIRLSPEDADAHNNFANLLMRQGKLNEAEMEYREAIRLNPRDPHLRQNLVALLLKRGKLREAEQHLVEALSSKRDDPYAAYNLANILAQQKKYAEAIPHLRRAIRLKPDYAEAHYNLGVMLQHTGKYDEALVEYREAVRLNPKLAQPHNNMAIILFIRKDFKGAWREVRMYEKLGGKPHPDFIKALSSKMPDPSN